MYAGDLGTNLICWDDKGNISYRPRRTRIM